MTTKYYNGHTILLSEPNRLLWLVCYFWLGHRWHDHGWESSLTNPRLVELGGTFHFQECGRCGLRRKIYHAS